MDPGAGGPPRIAASLAAAQTRLGHPATLAAPHWLTGLAGPGLEQMLATIPGIQEVRLVDLPAARGWERWRGRGARRVIQGLLDGHDLVHLHGVWETALRAAAVACRRAGRPYVVLLNGMLDPWALRQKPLKKRLALLLGYRRMLEGAAALHVSTQDEADLLAPLRLRPPTVVIPNGVFPEHLENLPRPGAFHKAHRKLEGRPYILFLSRLHYKKGLDYLIEAFALLAPRQPEVRLVVAGPDDGARADLEQRVAAQALTERVHLVGPIFGRAKWEALADACCFCLPSRQEGFSVAVLEALAAGLPVVISRHCHFPQVPQAGAGLVTELEPAPLAQALETVLADPALRQRMGQAARDLVRQHFTWPAIAGQTLQAYQRLAAGLVPAAGEPTV